MIRFDADYLIDLCAPPAESGQFAYLPEDPLATMLLELDEEWALGWMAADTEGLVSIPIVVRAAWLYELENSRIVAEFGSFDAYYRYLRLKAPEALTSDRN